MRGTPLSECLSSDLINQYFLIESEENLQSSVDTRESHEGETQKSGREHHDSHTLHALWNLYQFELLTHAGKNRQSHSKANGCREGIDHALKQIIILLNTEDGNTKHGTVGRDKRQEDTESLIQCR